MSQSAYVWQRNWNSDVQRAVQVHGDAFDRVIVLAAEISWKGSVPSITRVKLDSESLRLLKRPIGLAIRSGLYHDAFRSDGDAIASIKTLAIELLDDAKAAKIPVAELQLDFDCAESKLEGYRLWVSGLSQTIAPVPLTITALPCWVKQPAFRRLIATLPEYVLQVHAMERPDSIDSPCALCDPTKARSWIEHASQCGVPFRVALPTYGYRLMFDAQGKFLCAGAEGPCLAWPQGTQFKELWANASEQADLVRALNASRPAACRGIIWYRLPCDRDALNWQWSTLETVMSGRTPSARLEASVRKCSPGLQEIEIVNAGEADSIDSHLIQLDWPDEAGVLAADGLNGFELETTGPGRARLKGSRRLVPHERLIVSWLRFETTSKVDINVRINE